MTRIPKNTTVKQTQKGDYEIKITGVSRFVVPRLLHVIEQVQGPGPERIATEKSFLGEALPESKK